MLFKVFKRSQQYPLSTVSRFIISGYHACAAKDYFQWPLIIELKNSWVVQTVPKLSTVLKVLCDLEDQRTLHRISAKGVLYQALRSFKLCGN